MGMPDNPILMIQDSTDEKIATRPSKRIEDMNLLSHVHISHLSTNKIDVFAYETLVIDPYGTAATLRFGLTGLAAVTLYGNRM